MTQATTELAVYESPEARDLMPILSIDQSITRYNAVVEFTKRVMKKGRDYGVIPGTERKGDDIRSSNATLLKPGAEKLCTLFGLSAHFEDYRVTEDWDKGLFYYAYRCKLSRGGRVVAEGIGSANSREKKYRRESQSCPACNKPSLMKSKYPPRGASKNTPAGWFCNPKGGGCGAEFTHDDPAVMNQAPGVDVNAAANQVNTLQKMAQKRALIAATLIATNASEFFTQDVEDMDIDRGGGEVIDVDVEPVVSEPPKPAGRQTKAIAPADVDTDDKYLELAWDAFVARGGSDAIAWKTGIEAEIQKIGMTGKEDEITPAQRITWLNLIVAGKFPFPKPVNTAA